MEASQQPGTGDSPAERSATPSKEATSREEDAAGSASPGAEGEQFQVVADAAVKQLGIVPSALPPKPLILRHIEPGSWADENGILVGDELVAVNNVRVHNINLKELDNYLRRERPLRLVFVRQKVSQIEPMTDNEYKELKRASTGEIEDFVEKSDTGDKVALGGAVTPKAMLSGITSQDAATDAVVGTWIYNNAYEYSIDHGVDGQLRFEEARIDEESGAVQKVMGTLAPADGWFVGEIIDSERRPRGWIRLRHIDENGTVVSNVRLPYEEEWSDEKVAFRKLEQPDRPVEVEEKPLPEAQAFPAQPQILDGMPIWPEQWGITRAQCRDLLRRLQRDPTWDPHNTMYTLVSDYVVPWTRGTGLGYALANNQDDPKEVNLLVSHSWEENAEEFLTTLGRSTGSRDVMWVCALSMYHAGDGAGPSIRDQLGCTPEESPFRRVLEHIRAHGQHMSRCWRWRSCLHRLPVLLVLLALLFFYTPIVIWGCVPSISGGQCLIRRIIEVDGRPQAIWVWSAEYEDWVTPTGGSSDFTNEVLPKAPYPATAACLLVAIIIWICLWRSRMYHGRLLAVPGIDNGLYDRLWCVHEVSTAATLGVPVVLANTMAWAGRCASSNASCSDGADVDRIRRIIEQDGKDGYEKVDGLLRRSVRHQQYKLLLVLLGWALPLIVFRSADQRLLSVSAGSLVGVSGLSLYFTGALGVLAGVSCCCLVMYMTARLEKGAPTCMAIVGASFFLVGSAVVVTAALMYFEDLRQEPPENWIHGLDFFFDECFGHLRLGAPRVAGCSRLSRFWGAFTQTLLLGGIFLMVFLLGAFCCPRCMKGILQITVFALVAAAALLTTSVYSETGLPPEEHTFSVVVFYLTALFSRSLMPIIAMWAGVSKWGITLYSRRRRRRTPSRSPERESPCTTGPEKRVRI
mmetsp:Transcript_99392/g.290131  ORF Transcript_99392/g.290131 Transcript_99392/m.290131 type:complete len:915 (-) Transcript_99392:35-2779(-)